MTQKNLIIFFIAISGFITMLFTFYAIKQRKAKGALAFTALMASMTIYSFAYALELTQQGIAGIKQCLMVEYIGIATLPAWFIIYSFQYTGKDKWLRPPLYLLLFLLSMCTLTGNITNDYHHLFYENISLIKISGLSIAQLEKGPLYWLHMIYINVSVLAVNILFLNMLIREQTQYKKQATAMLIGTFIPWSTLIMYLAGFSPYGIDTTPFSFAFMGPVLSIGLFRYRLLDIVPVARHYVFESMRDPVLVFDIQNRIADYNTSAKKYFFSDFTNKITGCPAEKALKGYPKIIKILHSETESQVEILSDNNDQQFYKVSVSPVLTRGEIRIGKIITLADITQQTLLMKKLREFAITDELTGLFNRRHFVETGSNELSRAKRYFRPVSVIMMDIDYFKKINDTYGHSAGDIVLKEVSAECFTRLRNDDLPARWGGEEFILMLPETKAEDAQLIAERLRRKIEGMKITWRDTTITITASFGVTGGIIPQGMALDDIIQKSDEALYRAKADGRNRVVII